MRCLYCGKPLPLLKKLTGGGEFCSDAHRHKYQEEYNKLALSRLLQAQSSPGETGVFPAPGSGLRQLAAPSTPPPGGQRALPAPSSPPSLPPASPLSTTAHHQAYRAPQPSQETPPPPKLTPRAVAPPAPPRLPTDPKEAPFHIRQHEPIAPSGAPGLIQAESGLLFAEAKPSLWQEAVPELPLVPFEWEAVSSAIQASLEPDPPEATAWRHPIEIRVPGDPQPASVAAFAIEPFASKVIRPLQPEMTIATRHPQPVRAKINLQSGRQNVKILPGELRLSAARDWELNLRAPDWRPDFTTIAAPAVVSKPTRLPASIPVPTGAGSERMTKDWDAKPVGSVGNIVEVFIDLSMLGILEDAPRRNGSADR